MTARLPDPHADPDPAIASQSRNNRSTQHQWNIYATHRQAIERLIVPESAGQTICVLGAGNCNDLDLPWLMQTHRDVHLVDLDKAALEAGVARQKVQPTRLHLHAPVDLTDIAAKVSAWSKSPPSPTQIDGATQTLLEAVALPCAPCDTVLSPCVLTQTINPVRDVLRDHYPPAHPSVRALRAALRARHLRTLAAACKPGGRAVIAIDLISSEKFPDLPRVPADQLQNFMDRFTSDRKSYRGLDPASLSRAVREDPVIRHQLDSPTFTPPWLWHLGLRRTFLVYAATFTRK